MTKQDLINFMCESKNEDEWIANKRKIRQRFGGNLPFFWNQVIARSGIEDQMASEWLKAAEKGD